MQQLAAAVSGRSLYYLMIITPACLRAARPFDLAAVTGALQFSGKRLLREAAG